MALDYKVIGKRLKKARLDKNLTQEQLSEKLEISIPFLSRIETGSSPVNLKRLNQICSLLDISEASILTGASKEPNKYLINDFNELFKNCSPDKLKLIYDVAKLIVEQ